MIPSLPLGELMAGTEAAADGRALLGDDIVSRIPVLESRTIIFYHQPVGGKHFASCAAAERLKGWV
jgi:hypothetical protein